MCINTKDVKTWKIKKNVDKNIDNIIFIQIYVSIMFGEIKLYISFVVLFILG